MDGALAHRAKDPGQHVKKVDADVGGDAAGFADIALPTALVPVTAGGDVGHFHLVDLIRRG